MSSAMVMELRKCPALFSASDQGVILAQMSADANALSVTATTKNNGTSKRDFSESDLTTIKNQAGKGLPKGMSWIQFFCELKNAFNTPGLVSWNVPSSKSTKTTVTCELAADDGAGGTPPKSVNSKTCLFDLNVLSHDAPAPGDESDGQKSVLDALLQFHFVHAHLKDAEVQLKEATRREGETVAKAEELEKEEVSLAEALMETEAELNTMTTLDKTTTKNLASLGENEGKVVCRRRNPLGKKDHKDYDEDLLRLVKSRYMVGGSDEVTEGPHLAVVRPYTTDELSQHTSNWTTPQRQALWTALDNVDEWDFDVFNLQTILSGDDHYTLARQEQGGALFYTMYALLWRQGLVHYFKINEQILCNWLSVIEAGYQANPYHNSMHAADVLHIMHFVMNKGGLAQKCMMSKEELFAALFAASIHDFDHPGVNNSFHIRTQTYYATLYNDRSVLENHHVASVFELMKIPKFNILADMAEETRNMVRDTVIELVLATDMAMHSKFVSSWKRRLQEDHDLHKKEDKILAMQIMLKMSDISNCGRPNNIYLRWGGKISDEFYMQGDRERQLGLPCSPFMNRRDPKMAKSQVDFMNFVVLPMFESISDFLPEMRVAVKNTEANRQYWVDNGDSEATK